MFMNVLIIVAAIYANAYAGAAHLRNIPIAIYITMIALVIYKHLNNP